MKESNATERTFHGLLSWQNQANKPGDDGRHGKYDRGGHRISESNQQCDDGDDAEYAPFKPWLALMCFGYIGMVVHVAIPSVERLRDHNSRRIAKGGIPLGPVDGSKRNPTFVRFG